MEKLVIGQTLRISDSYGVVGGGVIVDIDLSRVTVDQPYTHRHNDEIIDRGTRPTRYALATHEFEVVS